MAAGSGRPLAVPLLLLAAALAAVTARLYRAGEDPLTVLTASTVRRALLNSSAAWVVQFYSSSCGHCIAFAPTWRALAGDVKGEAQPPPAPVPSAPAPGGLCQGPARFWGMGVRLARGLATRGGSVGPALGAGAQRGRWGGKVLGWDPWGWGVCR